MLRELNFKDSLPSERLRPTRFMALFKAAYSTGDPDSKNIDSFSIRTYKNVRNSAFFKKKFQNKIDSPLVCFVRFTVSSLSEPLGNRFRLRVVLIHSLTKFNFQRTPGRLCLFLVKIKNMSFCSKRTRLRKLVIVFRDIKSSIKFCFN